MLYHSKLAQQHVATSTRYRALLLLLGYQIMYCIETNEALRSALEMASKEIMQTSVICISMGFVQGVTRAMGTAIVIGILQTSYNILWSLRESNHDVLKGFSLSKECFFVSSWESQQTDLRVLGTNNHVAPKVCN